LKGTHGCDFSFSGLKTALRLEAEAVAPLGDTDVADLSASFQAAVADVIDDRTRAAIGAFLDAFGAPPTALVAAGGVAANRVIRARLTGLCLDAGIPFIAPPPRLCTDNAAMIAWAGAERLAAGLAPDPTLPARARWPLDEDAEPLVGAGAKGAKA
jgi:N6-L-threonylcarbamoyladenine synthase